MALYLTFRFRNINYVAAADAANTSLLLVHCNLQLRSLYADQKC
jgi:hypothetical protein